jgi:hypothetical protein
VTRLPLTGVAGAIVIGLGVVMFLTNPEPKNYEKYAEQTLDSQLKEKLCLQVSQDIGKWVQSQCHTLVDTARPQIAKIVTQNTTRQNFILFSIYQTDLPLPSSLPDYHAETFAILGNFYTYQIDRL